MRAFEGKNYYEILNLPLTAGFDEVKQAYAEALEMYGEDALATYALFTDEQREKLLQVINEAFQTLANEEKRADYNQMLISTGKVEAAMFSLKPQTPGRERRKNQLSSKPGEHEDRIEQRSKEEEVGTLADAISDKSIVSGEDLRQMREARGIDISEIFERTRISKTTLERIERDQYEDLPAEIILKSFLKSYAEIIEIDPKYIVDGYLKYRALSE